MAKARPKPRGVKAAAKNVRKTGKYTRATKNLAFMSEGEAHREGYERDYLKREYKLGKHMGRAAERAQHEYLSKMSKSEKEKWELSKNVSNRGRKSSRKGPQLGKTMSKEFGMKEAIKKREAKRAAKKKNK